MITESEKPRVMSRSLACTAGTLKRISFEGKSKTFPFGACSS